MHRDRWLLAVIWLLTAVVVAVAALLVYHSVTRVPDLAGRRDPADLYADPGLLFTDPGILGTAVEVQVTAAVRACMEDAGLAYRGPAVIEGLDALLDPVRDGYGIAAGPQVASPRLGAGGPSASERAAYETALYGAGLAGAEGPGAGCAAAGRAALDAALATLGSLPYSIDQLEADASAHPAYTAALGQWSACMAERGYAAASPEELVAAQVEALASASGNEGRALADQERQVAAADFACRSQTLDPAMSAVAADLAPQFVEQNRQQLAALIPPPDGDGASTEGLGTGDVQVTLRWTSTVDLDLSVTDPNGAVVSYSVPTIASGGRLDRDANFPCGSATVSPVENVFWPPHGAPPGPYRATVLYQTACATAGTQAYELIVRIDGQVVEQVRSTIEPGQELTIEFTYEGT
jgi:hypothetical protein